MASINDLATAAIASSSSPKPAANEASTTSTKRGAFIVLEGLDRSGKTTQAKLLEQRFVEEGRPVKVMRFPGESGTRRGSGGRWLTRPHDRQDDAHRADD